MLLELRKARLASMFAVYVILLYEKLNTLPVDL